MPAQNHAWTINEIGTSDGPASGDRHKPDAQVDITPSLEARQNISSAGGDNKYDVNPAPERVAVPDPDISGSIPDPGCGDMGQPLDWNAVAPDTDRGVTYDLEGVDAPEASGTGVLFRNGGPLD